MSLFRSWIVLPTATVVVLSAFEPSCSTGYSLHPLATDSTPLRMRQLIGAWRDSSKAGGDQWVFLQPDTTNDELSLGITNPADAAVLAAATEEELSSIGEHGDDVERRIRRDPAFRMRRARDSVAVYRLLNTYDGARFFAVSVDTLTGVSYADIGTQPIFGTDVLGRSMLLPTHWFWKFTFERNRVTLTPLNETWLAAKLKKGELKAGFDHDGDQLVLTASTDTLRALVRSIANEADAWPSGNTIVLQRVRPGKLPQKGKR